MIANPPNTIPMIGPMPRPAAFVAEVIVLEEFGAEPDWDPEELPPVGDVVEPDVVGELPLDVDVRVWPSVVLVRVVCGVEVDEAAAEDMEVVEAADDSIIDGTDPAELPPVATPIWVA
jgi:hypothetical protein